MSHRRGERRDALLPMCIQLDAAFGDGTVVRDTADRSAGEPVDGDQAARELPAGEPDDAIEVDAVDRDTAQITAAMVAAADAILVAIGPEWLAAGDSLGRRRLDDTADPVRTAIRAALDAAAPTIPVLLHGARLPSRHDLPDDIGGLAGLTPTALPDGLGFHAAVESLVERIGGPRLEPRPEEAFVGRWWSVEGVRHEIVLDGDELALDTPDGGAMAMFGRGRVIGDAAVIDVADAFDNRGRLEVRLAHDGGELNGWFVGQTRSWTIRLTRTGPTPVS